MHTQPTYKRKAIGYRLLAMLIAIVLLCPTLAAPASADSPLPENKVPGWVESTARRLANGFKQQGYEVARGYFKLYTQDDCPFSYDVPNPERFFLQYFARDCTGLEALTAGSHCYSIGAQLPDCPDPDDLTCPMLALSLRDYLLPSAQRGPAPELKLNPVVIPLQRP